MEENRLKAKARIQHRAAASSAFFSTNVLNGQGKRPLRVESAETPSPTAPNERHVSHPSTVRDATSPPNPRMSASVGGGRLVKTIEDPNAPLPRAKGLGNYIEFDLSKLHNSKGGFLIDENEGRGKDVDEIRKEREREQQRIRESHEPSITLDRDRNPLCEHCKSPEIDFQFHKVFGVRVCAKCRHQFPEEYSLLTKTECKEDYLLTDAELRDEELLPHLLKANPHKATWNNMMLFLRKQVEAYAFSSAKWGSEEGLDAEFARRQEEQKRKRGKKFQDGLRELRRRTRDSAWQQRKDAEHHHTFGDAVYVGEDGVSRQKCLGEGCEFEVEVETF